MEGKDLKKWQWVLVYAGIVISSAAIVWGLCELVRINISKF